MSELCGIFDSHSHYDSAPFDEDRSGLLSSMLGEGSPVCGVIHAATDADSIRFGIDMSRKYKNFYTSVGYHPELQFSLPEDPEGFLEKALERSDKIVAVGEVGLDRHFEGFDAAHQSDLLKMQIEFAQHHSLPLIFHCRDATEDFLDIMREYKPEGVVHCFSGSPETARELLSLGLYLGFGGVLTFKNSKKIKRAFAEVPADRFLFETDCPYLAPEPFRGKRCDSRMIAEVAKCAEEIKGIPAQQLIDLARQNTETLFRIGKDKL